MRVKTSKGRYIFFDAEDLELVAQYIWHANRNKNIWYAVTWNGIQMHRVILDLEPGDSRMVDHMDGNGLNNRRSNLRVSTSQQNRWNSSPVKGARSKYKGVNWHLYRSKKSGKWRAQIAVGGKQRHLGLFATEEAAAYAYDEAALKLHGEFARLNFLKVEA